MHFESYAGRRYRRTLTAPAWAAAGAVIGVGFSLFLGLLYPADPTCLQRLECRLYPAAETAAQSGPYIRTGSAPNAAQSAPLLVCGGAK